MSGKGSRWSVKFRIAFWCAVVLVSMAALVYVVLQLSISRQSNQYAAETLEQAVADAADAIELKDGALHLGEDLEDISYAEVFILDMSGRRLLYGPVPEFDAPLTDGAARRVEGDEGSAWYVYDVKHNLTDSLYIWIRAGFPMSSITNAELYAHRVFLSMVLPLVLLGILGGYLLTRRAFRPIARMAAAAEGIVDGKDLSRRIGGHGRDEFGRLGAVLDAMLERLQGAFQREKQFTSDVSHELRTPLAVIRAQCELARQEDSPEQLRRSLAVIEGQEERLSRMVQALLTLSRMDAGTQRLTPERVDLSEIMLAVAEELKPEAEGKGIAISAEEVTPGCALMGDELMLLRMVVNLIKNAVAFGREGGHVWLSLAAGEDGMLTGEVRDDGIGISPEQLPYIWQRFWQADSARSAESGSSGLGLAMVRWIVEAHGGAIEVQSQEGRGSVFRFRLPRGDFGQA